MNKLRTAADSFRFIYVLRNKKKKRMLSNQNTVTASQRTVKP